MIETYKILTGKYDVAAVPTLVQACTYVTWDFRNPVSDRMYECTYHFTNGVVNTWKSLLNWVISANTTNTFKNRLDKFWQNREIIHEFPAQLEGTGSRSEV